MRATGIVRKIDDLGRVIIPKEIRRSMNIKEGDPLEIFVQDQWAKWKRKSYNELSIFSQLKRVWQHSLFIYVPLRHTKV